MLIQRGLLFFLNASINNTIGPKLLFLHSWIVFTKCIIVNKYQWFVTSLASEQGFIEVFRTRVYQWFLTSLTSEQGYIEVI